jgi:hypothetical protein
VKSKLDYYNLHSILRISCESDHFIPEYFKTQVVTEPDIMITQTKTLPQHAGASKTELAPGLCYSKAEQIVSSTVNLLGLKAFWSIKKLNGKPTVIVVDRYYRLLSKTLLTQPISTAFPDLAFTQMITHVKLLQKKHTFLVGACFESADSKESTLISSMGGMGKTSLVFKLMEQEGNKYLSDDMTIVGDEGKVYAYPKPVRIRQVSIPPMHLEKYAAPATLLGSSNRIKNTSKIGNIVLLERALKTEVKTVSLDDALHKLLLINRKLLPYNMERAIVAYSYMDTSFSILDLMETESKILEHSLKDANCYILCSKYGDVQLCARLLGDIANGDI